jgi:hypothetical protein
VERDVGASDRVLTGTYTLAGLPGGGTRITFRLAAGPARRGLRRAAGPCMVRRGNERAMERLAGQLRAHQAGDG